MYRTIGQSTRTTAGCTVTALQIPLTPLSHIGYKITIRVCSAPLTDDVVKSFRFLSIAFVNNGRRTTKDTVGRPTANRFQYLKFYKWKLSFTVSREPFSQLALYAKPQANRLLDGAYNRDRSSSESELYKIRMQQFSKHYKHQGLNQWKPRFRYNILHDCDMCLNIKHCWGENVPKCRTGRKYRTGEWMNKIHYDAIKLTHVCWLRYRPTCLLADLHKTTLDISA